MGRGQVVQLRIPNVTQGLVVSAATALGRTGLLLYVTVGFQALLYTANVQDGMISAFTAWPVEPTPCRRC